MIDTRLRANFETKTTLGINKLLVSFDSKVARAENNATDTTPVSARGTARPAHLWTDCQKKAGWNPDV